MVGPVYRIWRRARLSRLGRRLAAARRDRLTPGRLARHERLALAPDPSYAGEGAHLRRLLARLGLERGGMAVDLAAGDGVRDSCTLPLFRDLGWSGLAVECDPSRFALLAHVYRRFPAVRLSSARVTPLSVGDLLASAGLPSDFTLLNLDLDSFDLPAAAAILERFRPGVVDMEVNEKVPPPIRFAVLAAEPGGWDEGHCYGCSLAAAADLLRARGYRLEGLEYNNAFFVREDLAAAAGIEAVSVEAAYRAGYAERPDRRRFFPWNADMDDLLDLPPARALEALRQRFGRAARGGGGGGTDIVLSLEPIEVSVLLQAARRG